MANRTLGNDISHRKIHQNGVLWLFREEKMTILLNFLKNAHFRTKNNHFFTPKTEKRYLWQIGHWQMTFPMVKLIMYSLAVLTKTMIFGY